MLTLLILLLLLLLTLIALLLLLIGELLLSFIKLLICADAGICNGCILVLCNIGDVKFIVVALGRIGLTIGLVTVIPEELFITVELFIIGLIIHDTLPTIVGLCIIEFCIIELCNTGLTEVDVLPSSTGFCIIKLLIDDEFSRVTCIEFCEKD
jgi:hypothetical protein